MFSLVEITLTIDWNLLLGQLGKLVLTRSRITRSYRISMLLRQPKRLIGIEFSPVELEKVIEIFRKKNDRRKNLTTICK